MGAKTESDVVLMKKLRQLLTPSTRFIKTPDSVFGPIYHKTGNTYDEPFFHQPQMKSQDAFCVEKSFKCRKITTGIPLLGTCDYRGPIEQLIMLQKEKCDNVIDCRLMQTFLPPSDSGDI